MRSRWGRDPGLREQKEELNQYWYSTETVDKLATEVLAETTQHGRVAFLSTPSVYFAVKSKQKTQSLDCVLFDVWHNGFFHTTGLSAMLRFAYCVCVCVCVGLQFDEKFATEGRRFVPFDFNKPEAIPTELHCSFDFLVIDPPFITKEVWQQYAAAANVLSRSNQSKILLTTIGKTCAALACMHTHIVDVAEKRPACTVRLSLLWCRRECWNHAEPPGMPTAEVQAFDPSFSVPIRALYKLPFRAIVRCQPRNRRRMNDVFSSLASSLSFACISQDGVS